jgi:alpha-D-ribose 1-methylphosphonate 5-phosphate C-P lyase
MEISKTKRTGVDARHRVSEEELEEDGKWLECEVIEEQPLVWIKKSSLTHGTVMLYHGET